MVGASDIHALIVNALAFALTPYSRKQGCQLFTSDMKVRLKIDEQDIFYYPDLLITCDNNDRASHFRQNPCLIVEVLSANTERLDRTEKMHAYQTLPSLKEYLLVSQNRKQVEIFRRSDNWHPVIKTDGDVQIQCLDCVIPSDEIYQDIGL
jgi:Uma2 family endonuclease